ncbi:MAG: exporter [Herminiimonas sp.]|nr:exporter [Herminiimonas sp.]
MLCAHLGYLVSTKRFAPDTDIMALLPAQERDPVLQQAFGHMVDAAQQKLIVVIGAPDWTGAKLAADAYLAALATHEDILRPDVGLGSKSPQDWLAVFNDHRDILMTAADESALRARGGEQWAQLALAQLQSPFGGPRLGPWKDDPFGLFAGWAQERARETPVRPRDGRLFVGDGNFQYVVMPMTLRQPAFALHTQEAIGPALEKARAAALASVPGARVLEAGVVLHAAAAGKQAGREVSTIGIGSLIGIALLVWFAFRSFKPIAYLALLIGVGCLGALSISLLVFGRVHLLTLVFGATLIGVAQDYGIYFLCRRLAANPSTSSTRLLRDLLPSLLLTLIAAAIGYLGLALTPFPGLRQMAVFSVTGLVFAWLTVICWYPTLVGPTSFAAGDAAARWGRLLGHWPVPKARRGWLIASVVAACVLATGWARLGVNDDLRSLQNPPRDLIAQQQQVGALLDAPTPVQFFLVRGADAEAVLQREEALKRALAPLIAAGSLGGVQAISNWVPSAKSQASRKQALDESLLGTNGALPLLARQLGEGDDWVRLARARNADKETLQVDAFLAAPVSEPFRHLWLGDAEGGKASIVALRGLRLGEIARIQQAGVGLPGVQWVDKVAEISSVLSRYRRYMGWALLGSYLAVFCLLSLRYRGGAWRVIAPAVTGSAVTLAILGLIGQPLQLFHLLALMLLLGIGVDYGVFFQERSGRRSEGAAWMAVTLSAGATLLSFGLLSLSRTPALQAFGTTMLLGTALVWVLVPCFGQRPHVSGAGDAVVPAVAA